MSYEIIDNPTPGQGEGNGTTGALDTDKAGSGDNTIVDTSTAGTGDSSLDPNANGDGTTTAGEGKPEGSDDGTVTPTEEGSGEGDEVSFYWGDDPVEIEIAEDVSAALQEKGLDAMAIAKELYSKDGSFNLSDETKQKLYDAFGKFSVDAYLSGLKAQNEMFLLNQTRDAERMEQANTERYQAISQEIGGEEGWGRLEAFALETLSDEELNAFNEVMNSGNQYLQAYAVRELESRRVKAQGDDKVTLIPGNAAVASEGGPLSRQEYQAELARIANEFKHDKAAHARAEAALDARRRAGLAKGL